MRGLQAVKVLFKVEVVSVSLNDGADFGDGQPYSVCFERGKKLSNTGDKRLVNGGHIDFNESLSIVSTLYRGPNGAYHEKSARLVLRRKLKRFFKGTGFKGIGFASMPLHRLASETSPRRFEIPLGNDSATIEVNFVSKIIGETNVDDEVMSEGADSPSEAADFDPDSDIAAVIAAKPAATTTAPAPVSATTTSSGRSRSGSTKQSYNKNTSGNGNSNGNNITPATTPVSDSSSVASGRSYSYSKPITDNSKISKSSTGAYNSSSSHAGSTSREVLTPPSPAAAEVYEANSTGYNGYDPALNGALSAALASNKVYLKKSEDLAQELNIARRELSELSRCRDALVALQEKHEKVVSELRGQSEVVSMQAVILQSAPSGSQSYLVEDLQQQLLAKETVEESLREEVEALRRLSVAEASSAGSVASKLRGRNGALTPEIQQYVDAQASSEIAVARVEVAELQAQLSQANSALQAQRSANSSYQQSLQYAEEHINKLSNELTEKSDDVRRLKTELQKTVSYGEVTQLRTDLEVTRAQLKSAMAVAESLAISQINKTPVNIDVRALAEAAVNAGGAFTTATVERDELRGKCDELARQLLLTKQRVLGYKGPRNASEWTDYQFLDWYNSEDVAIIRAEISVDVDVNAIRNNNNSNSVSSSPNKQSTAAAGGNDAKKQPAANLGAIGEELIKTRAKLSESDDKLTKAADYVRYQERQIETLLSQIESLKSGDDANKIAASKNSANNAMTQVLQEQVDRWKTECSSKDQKLDQAAEFINFQQTQVDELNTELERLKATSAASATATETTVAALQGDLEEYKAQIEVYQTKLQEGAVFVQHLQQQLDQAVADGDNYRTEAELQRAEVVDRQTEIDRLNQVVQDLSGGAGSGQQQQQQQTIQEVQEQVAYWQEMTSAKDDKLIQAEEYVFYQKEQLLQLTEQLKVTTAELEDCKAQLELYAVKLQEGKEYVEELTHELEESKAQVEAYITKLQEGKEYCEQLQLEMDEVKAAAAAAGSAGHLEVDRLRDEVALYLTKLQEGKEYCEQLQQELDEERMLHGPGGVGGRGGGVDPAEVESLRNELAESNAKVEVYLGKLQEGKEYCEQLQQELDEVKAAAGSADRLEVDRLRAEVALYLTKLQEGKEYCEQLQEELDEAKNANNSSNVVSGSSRSANTNGDDVTRLRAEVALYLTKLQEGKEYCEQLQQELDESKAQVAAYEVKMEEGKDFIEKLHDELDQLRADSTSSTATTTASAEKAAELTRKIAELQEVITSQEEKLSQAEDYVAFQREQVGDLESEIERLRNTAAATAAAQKQSSGSTAFAPLAGGAVSTGDAEGDIEEYKLRIEAYEAKMVEGKEFVDSLEAEIDTLRNQNDDYFERLQQGAEFVAALEKQKDEVAAELEQARQELVAATQQVQQTQQQLELAAVTAAEAAKHQTMIDEDSEKKSQELQVELQQLQVELDRVRGELENSFLEIDTLKSQNEEYSERLQQGADFVAFVENERDHTVAELEQVRKQLETVNAELQKHEDQAKKLTIVPESASSSVHHLDEEKESEYKNTISELQQECVVLRATVDAHETKLIEMTTIGESAAATSASAGEESIAEIEVQRLQTALERAEAELQQQQQQVTDAIDRIKHLESMLHDEQQQRAAVDAQVAENAELLERYRIDNENYLRKMQEGALYVQHLQQQIEYASAEIDQLRLAAATNGREDNALPPTATTTGSGSVDNAAAEAATAHLELELTECKAIISKYGKRLEQASTLIDTLEKDLKAAIGDRDATKAELAALTSSKSSSSPSSSSVTPGSAARRPSTAVSSSPSTSSSSDQQQQVKRYKQTIADLEHKISILEIALKEANDRIVELLSAPTNRALADTNTSTAIASSSATNNVPKENQHIVDELVTMKMTLANTALELDVERHNVAEAKAKLLAFSKQVKDLKTKLAAAEAKANESRGISKYFG